MAEETLRSRVADLLNMAESRAHNDALHEAAQARYGEWVNRLTAALALPDAAPFLREETARELLGVARWIRQPGNIDPDDARDECARVLENRAFALCRTLAEGTPVSPWQPIETAKEDPDTYILVRCPAVQDLGELICPCKWHPDAGFCVDELRTPTHWMPLPARPTRAEQGNTIKERP